MEGRSQNCHASRSLPCVPLSMKSGCVQAVYASATAYGKMVVQLHCDGAGSRWCKIGSHGCLVKTPMHEPKPVFVSM